MGLRVGIGMRRVAVVAALAVVWGSASAQAEAIGPERAAEMLAHAWMVDNRCNVLSKTERDALTGFVARAELSLAQLRSVEAARKAIRTGRASGTSAACDPASAQVVRDTLRVAMSATAGMAPAPVAPLPAAAPPKTEERKAVTKTAEPTAEVAMLAQATEPPPAKPAAKPPKVKAVDKADPKPASGAMAGYAVTAEAYYRELRCRNRSFPAVNALYAKVLRQHRQAVAAGGKAAVKALLKAAEARAARGAC
ncbi:hypothetical protein [Aestuariivirga sp.]|uniref:hypothetical protein n=1 Tax=Aestuariivirga sp. TaxID=2650926 RepID=UPI0039E36F4F